MEYLYILREALVWMVTIFWIYQMAISVCALIKFKDKPLKIKKDHRFMAIIPAHNEEAVVGNLIESLKNQTYNKELYDIDAVDKNIDFRRVKNLKVYFDNNAISLTTEINEIEEWQGGDIVVFKKHIGIVSDNRNKKGMTFIIHHANPYQRYYEEDILEYYDDIVGHYRIS